MRVVARIVRMDKRIFFALWPSPQTAAELMPWVRDAHTLCGGRMMTPDTLHLTLAFLGNVPACTADDLSRQARAWPAAVGPLTLQRYGRFQGPRTVWAGPGRSDDDRVPWLDSLHDALWQRLRPLGFEPDHDVFRPHVSLLRRAGPGDLGMLAPRQLTWVPHSCVLVASEPATAASRYTVLARMPLHRV